MPLNCTFIQTANFQKGYNIKKIKISPFKGCNNKRISVWLPIQNSRGETVVTQKLLGWFAHRRRQTNYLQ